MSLNLFQKRNAIVKPVPEEEGNDKFKFLLSVLDSFDKRKLQFCGQFYAGLLFEGARLGGLEKRIASLVADSKTDASTSQMSVHIGDVNLDTEAKQSVSWTEILEEYPKYKDSLEDIHLPAVRVKSNEKEFRQVLQAERGVTYNQRRRGTQRNPRSTVKR